MIPLVAVIRVRARARISRMLKPYPAVRIKLWIPLFLIWLLLLPFVLLLLPLAMLACLVVQINPFRALAVLWQALTGLRGTNIEVNDADAVVAVRIF
jgi:hypothetical protein